MVRSANSWVDSWPLPAITTTSPRCAEAIASPIASRRSTIVVTRADDSRGADLGDLDHRHAESLYHTLEHEVLPAFHDDRERWAEIMRGSIAINGSYFTTERMMREYAVRAYC